MDYTVTVMPDTEKSRKSRIAFDVSTALRDRFKASCSLHGKNMSERLIEIMAAETAASGIPVGTS